MGTFLAEWWLAILVSLAVLGVLIYAEWRDYRDGLYDDDPLDDDEPDQLVRPDGHDVYDRDAVIGPYASLGTGWRLEPHELTDPADRDH